MDPFFFLTVRSPGERADESVGRVSEVEEPQICVHDRSGDGVLPAGAPLRHSREASSMPPGQTGSHPSGSNAAFVQGGTYVLQLMDVYGGGTAVIFIAIAECISIVWIYGMRLRLRFSVPSTESASVLRFLMNSVQKSFILF